MDACSWFAPVAPERFRRPSGTKRIAPGTVLREGRKLWDFASNDYLGLCWHPKVRAAAQRALDAGPFGSGASRWIVGDDPAWHELEERLAAWKGFEAALVVGSGMLANIGLLQALGGRDAVIFADRLNHASLVDGARLALAKLRRFRHRDYDQLETMLAAETAKRRIIVSDGVFSMDGDCADLRTLIELAERFDAILVLDDAHGLGVVGPNGRGLSAEAGISGHPRLIEVGTLGKAFGGYGAFILAPKALIEGLWQRLRTAIFSTMPPACVAHAMLAALELLQEGSCVQALQDRIARFAELARAHGFAATQTAIQPVILGSDETALQASRKLAEKGFFVPAIRPPTVPEGTSRLRISLSAAQPIAAIEALANELGGLLHG